MNPMIRRQQAAQATIDRFVGKTYRPGTRDCIKLAAFVLRQRGYKLPLLKGLKWSSEAEALRALRRTGFATLVDAVDALELPQIAPAAALPWVVGTWATALLGGGLGLFGGSAAKAVKG